MGDPACGLLDEVEEAEEDNVEAGDGQNDEGDNSDPDDEEGQRPTLRRQTWWRK